MARTYCDEYFRHKIEVGDYNIMGQALKVLCQLEKTNFDDNESVKVFAIVAEKAGEIINGLAKNMLEEIHKEEAKAKEKLEEVS